MITCEDPEVFASSRSVAPIKLNFYITHNLKGIFTPIAKGQPRRAKRKRATHPELMDEKGELIDEDLFAVRFGILGDSDDCPDHQSFGKVPFALYRTRLKQKSRS